MQWQARLAAVALAVPVLLVVLARVTTPPPPGWSVVGRPDPRSHVELTIAIKQRNLHLLEEVLLNVSDPKHPHWGRHLTFEEVNELVAAKANIGDIYTQQQVDDLVASKAKMGSGSNNYFHFIRPSFVLMLATFMFFLERGNQVSNNYV